MKVCLIGKVQNRFDEGVSNTLLHISKELSKKHNVIIADRKRLLQRETSKIRSFSPDVLHYFSSPSTLGFPFAKLIARFVRAKVSVISALNPKFLFFKEIITAVKPDVVLVQSTRAELLFRRLGCKTVFVPSGVDTSKFKPVTYEEKIKLRAQYGIPEEKFVVLHIGHIKNARNLRILADAQSRYCQVLIVGSLFGSIERGICEELKRKGCIVWGRYFDNIEEIYKMADCYVFPTTDEAASIGIPLTVLEAMACNLSVVTTPFGGLPRIFQSGDGLFFLKDLRKLPQILEYIHRSCLGNSSQVKTRKKVLPYSWERIAARVESIYRLELLSKR